MAPRSSYKVITPEVKAIRALRERRGLSVNKGSVPETYFTFYTGDMVYTFLKPNGSSIGSTFLLLSSKYPKS